MASEMPLASPLLGLVRWVFGQVNWLPQGQIILGEVFVGCHLPSCLSGVHWELQIMVLNCVVCELQENWLWAIIQVQQSLMVASSDFSHLSFRLSGMKFPWNLKEFTARSRCPIQKLGKLNNRIHILWEGSRGKPPRLAPCGATPRATSWMTSYFY